MAFYECGLRALHYFLAPFKPRPLTTSVSFRMVRTGKDTQGPPLLRVTQRQRACHRSGSGVFSGPIGSTLNCMGI